MSSRSLVDAAPPPEAPAEQPEVLVPEVLEPDPSGLEVVRDDRILELLEPERQSPARRHGHRRERPPSRRRGWAGRGPVGLVAVEPPKYIKWQASRTSLGWTVWRFFTGAELDGKRRTDATWLRWGTRQYIWSDRMPINWVAWPRILRAAARLVGIVAAVLVARAYRSSPELVTWAAGIALWAGLCAAGWAAASSLLLWPHRRKWVWPLHWAIANLLHYHSRTQPRRYIWLPPDFRRRGMRVALPPWWTGVDDEAERGDGERKARALVAAVRQTLALGDIETHWKLAGDHHELIVASRRDRVPAKVRFDHPVVRAWVDETPRSALLLGVGATGPVRVDLDSESPHLLLSMLSGEGKSVLLRSLIAQVLHRGGKSTVLDFKHRSQKCYKRVPNVHYCRHPENMHLALVALAMEGNRRAEQAYHWEDSGADGEPVFDRHLLVIEEANATIYKLQLWWDLHRRELTEDDVERYCGHFGHPGLAKSPAVLALGDILFMGRESDIHCAAVGQYATAHSLGGPEIREQFGARGIKGPRKAFAMLADELDTLPVSRGHRGRFHLVHRGQANEVQGMLMTEAQARDWATSGWAPEDAGTRGRVEPVDQGNLTRTDAQTRAELSEPALALEQAAPELVTLKDAARMVGRTHDALRNDWQKDPAFPQPAVRSPRRGKPHLWARDDVRLYHQNRDGRREVSVDVDQT